MSCILLLQHFFFKKNFEIFTNLNYLLEPLNLELSYKSLNFWFIYSNLITPFLLFSFIVILSLFFFNKASHIKSLNLLSAFFLILYLYQISLDYNLIFINANILNQNVSFFFNLFIFIAIITSLIFFLGISDVFYIEENSKIEFSLLVWCIFIASIYLISSTDFISIIILLECIAFSSYVLVGFERKNKFSVTSALQYLILASIPSGFFILGLVLFYNNFGTFSQDYLVLILDGFTNFAEESQLKHIKLIEETNSFYSKIIFNFDVEYLINFFSLQQVFEITLIKFLQDSNAFLLKFNPAFFYEFISEYKAIDLKRAEAYIPPFDLLILYWKEIKMELIFATEVLNIYYSYMLKTPICDGLEMMFQNNSKIFQNKDIWSNTQGLWQWLYFLSGFECERMADFNKIITTEGVFYNIVDTFAYKIISDFTLFNLFWSNLSHIFWFDLDWDTFYIIHEKALQRYAYITTAISDILNLSYFLHSNNTDMLHTNAYLNYIKSSFIFNLNYNSILILNWEIMEILSNISENVYLYGNTLIIIYLALIFIIGNISFKLTAAPFHFWAPTVYGGSPLATLTFLSIFSKLSIIFFSIWMFINVFDSLASIWQFLLFMLAFLSIFISILGAFSEKIFKRFFVYSSIGHVGFMLLGIATLNLNGLKGTIDYLIIYIISSFIVWFIILHLTKKTMNLVNLKGLAYNQPYLSLIFTTVLFSLSGIPPFGGFFVKYEIFYSLIESSFFLFAYILLLLTVISFFYYLRLIKIFYFESNKKFYKIMNLQDFKLRLIAIGFFIIPFFILFADDSISNLILNIIQKSLY